MMVVLSSDSDRQMALSCAAASSLHPVVVAKQCQKGPSETAGGHLVHLRVLKVVKVYSRSAYYLVAWAHRENFCLAAPVSRGGIVGVALIVVAGLLPHKRGMPLIAGATYSIYTASRYYNIKSWS